jgi:hypothetical protein
LPADRDILVRVNASFPYARFVGAAGAYSSTCVLDMANCCNLYQHGETRVRSCIPPDACRAAPLDLLWAAEVRSLFFVVENGHYELCRVEKGRTPRLALGLLKAPVDIIPVLSMEERFIETHWKRGAKQALEGQDGGLCGRGSALCGDACFGVCEGCKAPR